MNAETEQKTYHVRIPELVIGRKDTPLLMAAQAPADTYNWDTVFAIKFPDVNKALAKPGASPTNFATSVPNGPSTSGTFSAWQLSGGDGELLHMQIPIATGSTLYNGQTYAMDGGAVTIEIQLALIPQPGAVADKSGQHDLKARTTMTGNQKPVSVTNLTVPGISDFIVLAVMGGLMEQWFTANLGDFTHAFSTVNLDMKADKDEFQWMKPTFTSYAVYASDENPDHSVFGVLNMTEGRSVTGSHQISPNAIPTGARAGFLIAQERFLEKLVMPGIPSIFQNATADDLEIANDGTQIRNKNPLYLEEVDINGTRYTPDIPADGCTITLDNQEVVFTISKAHITFSPGIDITMYYQGNSNVTLITKTDGSKALNYEQATQPIVDHNVEVAAWVTWTEVAASVAAALVTLGTGALAKKLIESITIRVIVTVITLLVGELIANIGAILDAVATQNEDKIPSVDLAVTNATNAITWPLATGFSLTSASLNGSLQFGGDPQFVD